jgi:hypothetical protein
VSPLIQSHKTDVNLKHKELAALEAAGIALHPTRAEVEDVEAEDESCCWKSRQTSAALGRDSTLP